MPAKSLHLKVPDVTPYDRADSWFESFVGHQIRPVAMTPQIKRFWFSRYDVNGAKSVRFRFEGDDLCLVDKNIQELIHRFGLASDDYGDYDWRADLGLGESSRFLGDAHRDQTRRGNVVFDFLSATSRLFLDCLAGPDEKGYFRLEVERKSGFSLQSSMEQFHHLFCNVTGAPCFAAVAQHPRLPGVQVMSLHEFRMAKSADSSWQLLKAVQIHF